MPTIEETRERETSTGSEGQAFSVASRARSFVYAGKGLAALLTSQHNAWIHACATVAVVVLAWWLEVPTIEWCLLVIAIMAVWVAEALNTAIEELANVVSRDHHPGIGRAKDIAAGGVLIAAIGAALVGLLILGPRLFG